MVVVVESDEFKCSWVWTIMKHRNGCKRNESEESLQRGHSNRRDIEVLFPCLGLLGCLGAFGDTGVQGKALRIEGAVWW